MKSWLIIRCALIALLTAGNLPAAYAQKHSVNDEVIITGSRIKQKSQKDKTSSTPTLGQETFNDVRANDIRDVVETLRSIRAHKTYDKVNSSCHQFHKGVYQECHHKDLLS